MTSPQWSDDDNVDTLRQSSSSSHIDRSAPFAAAAFSRDCQFDCCDLLKLFEATDSVTTGPPHC